MLGMRTTRGISREEYRSIYLSEFDDVERLLQKYVKKGWAAEEKGRWHFTTTGFLVSNPLIGALMEAQAQQKISAFPWLGDDDEAATAARE